MKRGFQVFYRYKELEDGDKVLVKKKKLDSGTPLREKSQALSEEQLLTPEYGKGEASS